MARLKFLRKDYWRMIRLGKNKKKLRKWRRAKGKHSKIREKRRGYLSAPEVGYGNKVEMRGLIQGTRPKTIYSINEIKHMKTGDSAIIGKIGNKKRIEIVKIAEERKIKILNLKAEKFLKKAEKDMADKKAKRKKAEEKKETNTKKKESKEKAKIEEENKKVDEKAKTEKKQEEASK